MDGEDDDEIRVPATRHHVATANRPEGLATVRDDCDAKARALEQRLEPGANLV